LDVFLRRSFGSVRRKLSVNHCAKKQKSAELRSHFTSLSPPFTVWRRNRSMTAATGGSAAISAMLAGGRCRPV
jgi:hypothetical protein